MDLKAQTLIMQAASNYANSGAVYLAQQLGREPSEQEALIFASALSSMTASFCYATIHQVAGRKAADTWVQQIFAQISMGVKTRGTPVQLQITLKSTPTAPEGKEAKPGELVKREAPVDLCKCVLDPRGNCSSCEQALSEDLGSVVDATIKMEQFQSKKRCPACVQKVFDGSFAKVVRERFKNLSPELRDMLVTIAAQVGAVNGVEAIPQAEKALTEV
jgi:hypothetical protein